MKMILKKLIGFFLKPPLMIEPIVLEMHIKSAV